VSELKITIYDKNFNRKGWLGAPESVTADIGFNIVGTAQVVFRADHLRRDDITTDGARMVIEYPGLSYPLISGPVRFKGGKGPKGQATITATIEDDLRILWRLRGWQVPTAAISNQGTSEYRTYTGNAETIVKTMVSENVARIPSEAARVSFAPNLNRGAVIPSGVKIRMHPLAERLFPAVEQAGLGVRCYQSGAGLVLDVYEPRVYPKILSEESGTLASWEWNQSSPDVTRVVGGGRGEGTARVFRSAIDAALESQYGDVIETFMDARNGETNAEIDQSNSEVLFEGKPKSGLSLELSETPYFRYGTVVVGDKVTIEAGGLQITDVLRTATITWTKDDGLSVKPGVGKIENSTESRINQAIKTLMRGLKVQKVR